METARIKTLLSVMLSVAVETNCDHVLMWGEGYDHNQHSSPIDGIQDRLMCRCLDGPTKMFGILNGMSS